MVILKISKDVVCEHNIYVELDKNYDIRNAYSEDTFKNNKEKRILPTFKTVKQLLDYFMVKS